VSTCLLYCSRGTRERTRIAHINNLYNTAFWALVQEGKQTTAQAHEALRVSFIQVRGGWCHVDGKVKGDKLRAKEPAVVRKVWGELQQCP
jgi:hypothetical protein